jgi:transposase-like protein
MFLYRQGLNLIKFVADKFYNYYFAWKRILAKITTMDAGVPIACKKYGLKHNNNAIERYNREIKRRMHTIVVFQTFDGAKDFFALRTIIYNYVNPHNSLKEKTPAEAAEIKLELGQNKLLNLIKLARKIEMTTR